MNKLESHRFLTLDALRGIGALMVFNHHYRDAFIPRPLWDTVWLKYVFAIFFDGIAAVGIFFVLSGFVLSLKPIKNGRFHPLYEGIPFIIRRFVRLLLPFWVVLTLSYLIPLIILPLAPAWFDHLPSRVLPLNELLRQFFIFIPAPDPRLLPQDWSLTVEANYSVWIAIALSLFFVSPYLFVVFFAFRFIKSVFALPFFLGILWAWKQVVVNDIYCQLSSARKVFYYTLTFLALNVQAVALLIPNSVPHMTDIKWVCISVGAFLLLIGLVNESKTHGFLHSAPLQFLGRVSYCGYLSHFIVLTWITPTLFKGTLILGPLFGSIVCYFSSVAIWLWFSKFLYKTIEIPSMRLAKKGAWPI